jgi:hypothetical protein
MISDTSIAKSVAAEDQESYALRRARENIAGVN